MFHLPKVDIITLLIGEKALAGIDLKFPVLVGYPRKETAGSAPQATLTGGLVEIRG